MAQSSKSCSATKPACSGLSIGLPVTHGLREAGRVEDWYGGLQEHSCLCRGCSIGAAVTAERLPLSQHPICSRIWPLALAGHEARSWVRRRREWNSLGQGGHPRLPRLLLSQGSITRPTGSLSTLRSEGNPLGAGDALSFGPAAPTTQDSLPVCGQPLPRGVGYLPGSIDGFTLGHDHPNLPGISWRDHG